MIDLCRLSSKLVKLEEYEAKLGSYTLIMEKNIYYAILQTSPKECQAIFALMDVIQAIFAYPLPSGVNQWGKNLGTGANLGVASC